MHTRYSPVCHSHSVLLHHLPSDLHVLGLPLAFILSQDQTLRCIQKVKLLLRSLPISYIRKLTGSCFPCTFLPNICLQRTSLNLLYRIRLITLFEFFSGYDFVFHFSGRKGKTFFLFSKTFLKIFYLFLSFVRLPDQCTSFVFRGRKGNCFFLSSKLFLKLFLRFFVCLFLPSFNVPLCLFLGAQK